MGLPGGHGRVHVRPGLAVGDGLNYGTDANFQANYRLTPSFVAAHSAPFHAQNRIWIGGYQVFGADVADYDALLTAERVAHRPRRRSSCSTGGTQDGCQIAFAR